MTNCKHGKESYNGFKTYVSYFCPDCGDRIIPQVMNPCEHNKRPDGSCYKKDCNGRSS